MFYSGIGSEAGVSIDQQIKATLQLGWRHVDLRNVDNVNITDISEERFEEVTGKLSDAGISVGCFASNVANWGKDARSPRDFAASLEELQRAIPRMQRLGTKMIRGMSFATPREQAHITPELERDVLNKMKAIVRRCEDAGLVYVMENCVCYFTQSYEHMDRIREGLDSPAFRVVFDPCNPLMTDNRMGSKPYKKQVPWEAYLHLKDLITYFHVKDGKYVRETDGIFPEVEYRYPGQGDADLQRILADLLRGGYDGGICIEPHIANARCDLKDDAASQRLQQLQLTSYVDYGRRTEDLIGRIRGSLT